jgi:hypothetical protein
MRTPLSTRCRPLAARRVRLVLVVLLWLAAVGLRASGQDLDALRGERVGWARLKTPSLHWMRHARGDPTLMQFLRANTSLNIDPTWYVADCQKLDEMCTYPLLFSQGIHPIADGPSRNNVAEYLRRGGFLLIDACINHEITPSPDAFLVQETAFLADTIPEARVARLPSTHSVYRCYFQIPGGRPPHTFDGAMYDPRWAKHGLYGIFLGSRLAGVISLSGLQCGWDRMPAEQGHDVACMRMLVNIYVYAMCQGG